MGRLGAAARGRAAADRLGRGRHRSGARWAGFGQGARRTPPGWERRHRLEQLGGPPPADRTPRLDPILFGGDPAARGNAWKERGEWDRAETAYVEAIHARPLNESLRDTLVRFQMECGHPDRAAATLEEAVRMMPEDSELGWHLGLIRLVDGRSGRLAQDQ